jgi:broad-specificity NMP kinase
MRRGKRVIVITGVPGTGKTTLADSLGRRLKDAEIVHVTNVVNDGKLFTSYSNDGAKIVDMRKLKARLERIIRGSKKGIVILESHLLCDIRIGGAAAVVLREHLPVMRRRLKARAYKMGKLNADLISEATDYCGIRAQRNYGYVFETFARDRKTVANVIGIIKGERPKSEDIDLMPEFMRMLKKDRTLLA